MSPRADWAEGQVQEGSQGGQGWREKEWMQEEVGEPGESRDGGRLHPQVGRRRRAAGGSSAPFSTGVQTLLMVI